MRIPHEVLFPPGATVEDRVGDAMLTGALLLTSVAIFIPDVVHSLAHLPQLVLSAMMVLPLLLRRTSPLATLALCTVAGALQLGLLEHPTPSLLAVPVVAYSVARWVPGRYSRLALGIGMVAALLGPLRWSPYISLDIFVLLVGACVASVITPYAVGRRWRELVESRQAQVRAAEERYQLLLAERQRESQLAEASVRSMIARELHDIVAHSLSVIIVQAEGGRAFAIKNPDAAVDALDTIAESGREALHEMRRILGVLRGSEASPDYSPAPTIGDIPELVARASDRCTLQISGQATTFSPALELTVYRVVQEALTNFLKHAGPDAQAAVRLTYEPTQLTVDITDDGVGVADEPSDGGGNGLRGMYERVSSMGGILRAGPRHDADGFRVTALFPVRNQSPIAPGGPA